MPLALGCGGLEGAALSESTRETMRQICSMLCCGCGGMGSCPPTAVPIGGEPTTTEFALDGGEIGLHGVAFSFGGGYLVRNLGFPIKE